MARQTKFDLLVNMKNDQGLRLDAAAALPRARGPGDRMMTRRKIIVALGAGLVWPAVCFGQQQGKVSRIGFLALTSQQYMLDGRYQAFLQGMRERDLVEGKHFVIEARFGDGQSERLPELAAELVRSKVDVIVVGGTPATRVVQKAAPTTPIVMVNVADPVGSGFVRTLARPGGNTTGLSDLTAELGPKNMEVLLSIAPRLQRLAVLYFPDNTATAVMITELQGAARKGRITVFPFPARTPEEIESAFSGMRDKADGLVIVGGGFLNQQARRIAELAAAHRLPSTSLNTVYASSGGLLSYGVNSADSYRRAATFVDKILRGAKPADLPVEEPTKFELVINMKTANALGITIPQSVLFRADRVIE